MRPLARAKILPNFASRCLNFLAAWVMDLVKICREMATQKLLILHQMTRAISDLFMHSIRTCPVTITDAVSEIRIVLIETAIVVVQSNGTLAIARWTQS